LGAPERPQGVDSSAGIIIVVAAAAGNIERFSKAWVHELASRFEYQDDEGVTRAGARAARQGFYSREDFLTVARWKRAIASPGPTELEGRHRSGDVRGVGPHG
jgi:hypothetical protein